MEMVRDDGQRPNFRKLDDDESNTTDLLTQLCDLILRLPFDSGDESSGDLQIVKQFMEQNPNFDLNLLPEPTLGANHELPLHIACQKSNELVLYLLAEGSAPEAFCRYGRNALHCAVDANFLDEALLKILIEHYKGPQGQYINSYDVNRDRRAAHYLAESPDQSLEVASAMENAGVDWTLKNRIGHTPFEVAAKEGHWDITSYLASLQWRRQLRHEVQTENDIFACQWQRFHSQNAALVQRWSSDHDKRTRTRILRQITPEYRFDRKPDDPVGGSGRDSGCITKKIGKSVFTSIVIPYFSSEFITVIDNREDRYRKEISPFTQCSDCNFNCLGLQCTSTLDEYCHPSLDSRQRNRDQVLSRYQSHRPEQHRAVLTVPQLWIWNIDKDLMTAMQKDTFTVFNIHLFLSISNFRDEFIRAFTPARSAPSPTLFSDLFAAVLMSECISALGSPSRLDLPEPIFTIFEKSISALSDKVRDYTELSELNKNDIESEKRFILEIYDIREELSMIKSVVSEQEQVWKEFREAKFADSWICLPEDKVHHRVLDVVDVLDRPRVQLVKYKRQIIKLDSDAQRVESSIQLQLDLKSKHAGLQEAHQTSLMSAAVIGFTIVTIIFTPISFLASLFALSTSAFQSHQFNSNLTNGAPLYESRYIAKWMVTVELATITVTSMAIMLALKLTGFSFSQLAFRFKLYLIGESQSNMTRRLPAPQMSQNEKQSSDHKPQEPITSTRQDDVKRMTWSGFRAKSRKARHHHVV